MIDYIRKKITRALIRIAMKTCVMGFTEDYLKQAYESEDMW